MGDQLNNPMLIGLLVYFVFSSLFLGLYISYTANNFENTKSNVNDLEKTQLLINSTQEMDSATGVLEILYNCFFSPKAELPWYIVFLFYGLPNVYLGVLLYDKIRG